MVDWHSLECDTLEIQHQPLDESDSFIPGSLKAICDGEKIGHLDFYGSIPGERSQYTISSVEVDFEHRGKGVGTALYKALCTHLKDAIRLYGGAHFDEIWIRGDAVELSGHIRERVFPDTEGTISGIGFLYSSLDGCEESGLYEPDLPG